MTTPFLTIVLGGHEYDISDIAALTAHDGLDMPPSHRITQRGALQNGETDIDYRLDPRSVKLAMTIKASSADEMYAARVQLGRIFAPANSIKLLFHTVNGVRALDCVMDKDGLTMGWDTGAMWAQKILVKLRAPDPLFYNPAGNAITFALGSGGSGFTVPTPVPTPVGASVLDASTVIVYTGTAISYPDLIRITGPITDAVITNETTGDKLDFTGTTIAEGDYYDIDCRYDYKTIYDSGGVRRINKLTVDSDLATFAIMPAIDGSISHNNSLRVTGTSVTSATKVDVTWFNKDNTI